MVYLTIKQTEALIEYFKKKVQSNEYLDATDMRESIEAILNKQDD